jgi:hypothetical protein
MAAPAIVTFDPSSRQRLSQGTAVEQSRAVAEVQAAVVIAQNRPRDTAGALKEMREVCAIQELADLAFFKFNRGGGPVTGASIHLARELARCWGNINYGIKELARDADRSEMLAFAWDLQTNARSETTFIVSHSRDTKTGKKPLTDERDIYENNANMGARRVRECIFAVLPVWFTSEAETRCRQTQEDGGGKPLATRIADAVGVFEEIGVSKAQLERKVGKPSNDWTGGDIAQLSISYKSIRRGEITRDEEFPPEVIQQPSGPADAFEAAATGVQPSAPSTASVPSQAATIAGPSAQEAAMLDLIDQFHAKIKAAKTVEELNAIGEDKYFLKAANEDDQLEPLMTKRRAELAK